MKWYHIDIRDITAAQFESWYAMADTDRRRKCDACRVREDRLRSIAGDHLARMGIAEHCAVAPEEIRFALTQNWKPYAVGLDVHFNLSHSGNYVVCAVSDRPVGIDVEQMRIVREKLARKVCCELELEYLQDAPGWKDPVTGRALRRFFRIWTSKEAYFKWLGTGITDLKSFNTVPHILSGGTWELDGHMVSIYE